MKKITQIIAGVAIAATFASCSVSGPVLITDNPGGSGAKTGEASYSVVLGIFRPKDADISIKKAAENGKITKVSSVDYKVSSKLFKSTYTTVVTGE